jgi:Uma2 family endonuclease
MDARGLVLTYHDYAALPDDGHRYELHDGALSVTPAPGMRHQRVSAQLSDVLREHVRARGLGEVLYAPLDVILSDTTVLQPDLVYLDSSCRGLIAERGVEGPPTLVVEILSPSTGTIDRVTKPALYARFGVPWLWLVDPTGRTLQVFRLEREAYSRVLLASGPAPVNPPPFPDLSLVPDALWP